MIKINKNLIIKLLKKSLQKNDSYNNLKFKFKIFFRGLRNIIPIKIYSNLLFKYSQFLLTSTCLTTYFEIQLWLIQIKSSLNMVYLTESFLIVYIKILHDSMSYQ